MISSIVSVGQSLWNPSIKIKFVLTVLFIIDDSPYFCPNLFTLSMIPGSILSYF